MGEQVAVPRMRTIMQCVQYFKENDKDSQINYYRIRQMALKGEIPAIRSGQQGKTILINLDALIQVMGEKCLEPDRRTFERMDVARGNLKVL